ncbi:tyrosine-type recombinase/integrase [Pleionea sp. CnH1-48]|uniref:tyrosine-type recombinase/integrase n=1 Tax=Pleionea sp. CnH1-48 TaxID=2954494 RepID=UPI00209822E0|nr:tyrosine-type recombinase/integrase [Pleionea sp. CnH1-48]MCO7227122.1 tyrosine-type recombinase/integrase [Pleionea sp. CnH1-48]
MQIKQDRRYLKQKKAGGVFLVQIAVPTALRHLTNNKAVLTRSTGTNNLREAKAHRDAFLREWESLKLQAGINPKGHRLRSLVADLKQSYKESLGDHDTAQTWLDGHDPEYYYNQGDLIMADAIRIAKGGEAKFSGVQEGYTLSEVTKEYRNTILSKKSDNYLTKILKAASRWEDFDKEATPLKNIGRAKVVAFIEHLSEVENLKNKTIRDVLSIFNKTWIYATNKEYIIDKPSPFTDHALEVLDSESYEVLTLEEWEGILINYLPRCKTIGAKLFMFLGITSGMRIEEISGLRKGDIKYVDGVLCFHVNDNNRTVKTKNAIRYIPVMNRYIDVIKKLAEGNPEDFLFNEALPTKNKHSGWFSSNILESKRTFGITTRYKSFHSLRCNIATACENAKIEERTAAWLCGHSRNQTLTYGLYSDGASIKEILKPAIDKVEERLEPFLAFDNLVFGK